MPKTKLESIAFTAVTAWIMVYIMTVYNTALQHGRLENSMLLTALKGMWLEFALIFLCAYCISGPAAKRLAFRVVRPGDRPIAVILAIQVFTVVLQVLLASLLGAYYAGGLTPQFVSAYLTACACNFIMAMPAQLLVAGPAARALFRLVFRRGARAERA